MDAEAVEEPKKQCKTCRKMVDESRHRMHELGCMRQNYWCNVCETAVAKSEKEEHEETMHAMKQCQYCGLNVMAMKIEEHEESCKQKPEKCKYCDEVLPPVQLLQHIQICGSKTDKCPDCGEYIKRSEMLTHKQEGHCDIIQASKKEAAEREAQKEKERHQQKLLEEYKKNQAAEEQKRMPKAPARPAPARPAPARVPAQAPVRAPVAKPKAAATRPAATSSLLGAPKQPVKPKVAQPRRASPARAAAPKKDDGGGGMSAYEQMLFQQFADGNDGADQLMGGGAGAGLGGMGMEDDVDLAAMQAMQDDLNVRKADSMTEQQLIGGDDDYVPRHQQRHQNVRQQQPAAAVRPNPALWQPSSLDDVFAAERDMGMGGGHAQQNLGGMPTGLGNQQMQNMGQFQDDVDIPAEEMDPELQAVLEMSKNLK